MLGKLTLAGALAALAPVWASAAPMLGFSGSNADAERRWRRSSMRTCRRPR
jgi:hypothetical protein